MFYEMRIYTFKPARAAEWLSLYRQEALPIQQELLGDLVGFFTTEIGDVNQLVHIWRYTDLNDRIDRRQKMAGHVRWHEFLQKVRGLDIMLSMESRILRPTEFSPLQ